MQHSSRRLDRVIGVGPTPESVRHVMKHSRGADHITLDKGIDLPPALLAA